MEHLLIVTSRRFSCVPKATPSAAEPSSGPRSLAQHYPVPWERSENNIFIEERERELPYPMFFSDYMIICGEIPEFCAVSAPQGFSDGLPCARVSAPLC